MLGRSQKNFISSPKKVGLRVTPMVQFHNAESVSGCTRLGSGRRLPLMYSQVARAKQSARYRIERVPA
jgi:hypothetical protein